MKEFSKIDRLKKYPSWIKPPLAKESGELLRVMKTFYDIFIDDLSEEEKSIFKQNISNRYDALQSVQLTDEIWSKLDNTDSWNQEPNDFRWLEDNLTQRNWKVLKDSYERGENMEMPIVAFIEEDNMYHLLSGNTRLLVAKVLGFRPEVLILNLSKEDVFIS